MEKRAGSSAVTNIFLEWEERGKEKNHYSVGYFYLVTQPSTFPEVLLRVGHQAN